MVNMGHIKHVFPGGNTSLGFYSFYEYILSQDQAKRIIIIKGGPGVGKSSFMRFIADEMIKIGYDAEFMHCSSDNNSLDGVVIPKLKIALIDGTTPHMVDPKNPGCIDEILYLGDYWNQEGICQFTSQIIDLNNEIKRTFNRAYKYLKSAKTVHDDIKEIYIQAVDYLMINKLTESIIERIFEDLPISSNLGKTRHLFASAITPEGLKNYIDSIIYNTDNIYILKGEPGTGKSTMLSKINHYANIRGLYTEAYHCAFDPLKIEHLFIPNLNTVLVTSNEYHNIYTTNGEEIIDFNIFLDNFEIKKYTTELNFDKNIFNDLLNQAISTINNAKRLHDLLETYYIPNMDFNMVNEKRQETLKRILKYAQE